MLQDTDTEDIYAHFDSVTLQMHEMLLDGHRVLVHCVAGVSRSAAIVLAYLVRYKRLSLLDAYNHMHALRKMVRPNLGFWRQLIAYEQMLTGRPASVKLVWTKERQSDDVTLLPSVYLQVDRWHLYWGMNH